MNTEVSRTSDRRSEYDDISGFPTVEYTKFNVIREIKDILAIRTY